MTGKLAGALVVALAMAVPDAAFSQGRRSRGDSGAAPQGQASGDQGGATGRRGGTSSGNGGSTGSGSGSTAAPAPAPPPSSGSGEPRPARARPPRDDGSGATSTGGATRGSDDSGKGGKDSGAVARGSDPDRPGVGRAVPRTPGSGGGGSTVIVTGPGYWGGFYPWGYGGLGIGGYYGGYYDPWWDNSPPYAGRYGDDDGSLRLRIKPREASVYVDGYFAGQVDDFDGVFQRLKIDPGPHRIEVREEGFEPLMFEVRIQPNRTISYKGTLEKSDDR